MCCRLPSSTFSSRGLSWIFHGNLAICIIERATFRESRCPRGRNITLGGGGGGSTRWIHSNYSSGTLAEEFRMGFKGKQKKKKKKRDDEANTLHDVLYVGGLSLVWIDKSILWKSDRRTDFYAWMTAVSIFNVDHFSLECRFIVSSTCLLCIFQTICHVYSNIFLFFSFWEFVVDTIEFLNLAIF